METEPQARPAERTLGDQVYDGLLEAIVEGRYARGSRLPTEAELVGEFGVSRPVVRAALSRLRADGIVASRRGSGSYVLRRPEQSVLQFVPIGSITDIQRCYEFRIEVEAAAAALAAQRRDEADIAAIRKAYDLMEARNRELSLGVDADAAFHLAVAVATHNPFFLSVQQSLAPQIAFGMRLSRSLSLQKQESRRALVQAEHKAIMDAIASGRSEGARLAMSAHIEAARNRMFDGEERPPPP